MILGAASVEPLWTRPELREIEEGRLRPGGLELTRHALHLMALRTGDRLLDVGCGAGVSARLAAGEFGLAVVALDPDLKMASENRPTGVDYVRAKAESTPLANECFDGVLCECVLSVASDRDAALDEMARILRPGGRLAISDLYLKSGGEHAARGGAGGCAAGAEPLQKLLGRLTKRGFRLLSVEDHSRSLIELAARLIFAGTPASEFGGGCATGSKPGYMLVVARKEAA